MTIENNSLGVVVATVDHTRRIVAERIAHTENAAVEMVASNSVAFEETVASKENVVAVEKVAGNWQPSGERANN